MAKTQKKAVENPPIKADPSVSETAAAPRAGRDLGFVGLLLVLAIALGLRVMGLTWGLPNSLHFFSYHPDETIMLTISTPELGGINPLAGKLLPHYYNYGSLPFYMINLAVLLGSTYGMIGPIEHNGLLNPANWAHAYLAGRILSVVMGVGTVWGVYAIGRRLWSTNTGLLAAFFVAVMPLHAQHSHYATVDVGATFWLVLSLVWTAKLLTLRSSVDPADADSGNVSVPSLPINLIRAEQLAATMAGVFAGLTAATKYSGVLVLLSLMTAVLIRLRRGSMDLNRATTVLAMAGVAGALAFIVTCPGCILDAKQFLLALHSENDHVMHHGEIYFQGTGPGWIYLVTRTLDAGIGLPLLLLSLAGIVYAAVKRGASDGILAAFALPCYILLGAAQSRYARYTIPLLPFLALWSARLVIDFVSAYAGRKAVRYSGAAVAVLVCGFTLMDCVHLLQPMTQQDPRDRAAVWLLQHAGPPAKIAFSPRPWFWSPAINPLFNLPKMDAWAKITPPSIQAQYVYGDKDFDAVLIRATTPAVVTLSEYGYYDALRLHQKDAGEVITELVRDYNRPIVFKSTHPIGGMTTISGLPTQDLPTDMLYPSPTILIYTRR